MSPMLWVAAVVMLIGAGMLVADVGAAALWIALIAIGVAVVVIAQVRDRAGTA